MDNYPYSCWRPTPVTIRPIVRQKFLQIASFPGSRIDTVFAKLSPLFPHAVAAPTVISTGFTNANAMLHVANCVANAGKIDHGEAYKFYAEGVTPSVARLYTAINAAAAAKNRGMDLSSVRYGVSGGAPAPRGVAVRQFVGAACLCGELGGAVRRPRREGMVLREARRFRRRSDRDHSTSR